MAAGEPSYAFGTDGGALCLDFANTIGDRPRCQHEHLHRYQDLVEWALQLGLTDASGARRLSRLAAARPRQAAAVLKQAIALREALYRAFVAHSAGRAPAAGDLDVLNAALREARRHQRLAADRRGLRWEWAEGDALDAMLWPVAVSAAELLLSPERPQVRECASEVCSWLFIDRSRGGRRRWCDMSACGNRAKARRFYERQRRR